MTRDEVRKLLEKGFDLGFAASGEGWNGEWGAEDRETDHYYAERRQQAIDEVMKEMEP